MNLSRYSIFFVILTIVSHCNGMQKTTTPILFETENNDVHIEFSSSTLSEEKRSLIYVILNSSEPKESDFRYLLNCANITPETINQKFPLEEKRWITGENYAEVKAEPKEFHLLNLWILSNIFNHVLNSYSQRQEYKKTTFTILLENGALCEEVVEFLSLGAINDDKTPKKNESLKELQELLKKEQWKNPADKFSTIKELFKNKDFLAQAYDLMQLGIEQSFKEMSECGDGV